MNALRARPWALLFVASLAINLFLGGMLAVRWWQRSHYGAGSTGFVPPSFRALGPEGRPIAERIWATHKEELSQRARAAHDARKRSAEALSAEPFDATKAAAALTDARAKGGALGETMNQAMLEVAGALPPAERAKFGQAMAHGRGPKGWGYGPWGATSSEPH
jgi:uncharacterized membrane protein